MGVKPGDKLGAYEIVSAIGKGGMGEVWRARDPRLGRDVAIKVSAQQFTDRFEREARAIAALNHSNICTLYDIGPDYLVMEYVEGETIQDRIRKGAMPLAQTLTCGTQIADALCEAHSKGITHRDLKPGNVMIAKNGVKVLDFGLAKFAAADETQTQAGVLVGTPLYMAPGQRDGRTADARTDIYALGLLLYEMATCKRAPQGQPLQLQEFQERFAHIVERCLAQEPEDRWQTARDLSAELAWAAQSDPDPRPQTVSRRAFLPWIAGAAAGAAGGAGIATWLGSSKSSRAALREVRFRLAPPDGATLDRSFVRQSLALSPVGGRLAMIALNEHGPMVWLQHLDSLTASPLPGTEGATIVFWSPDGEFIGFWADGKIKKIRAEGGTPVPVCELVAPSSAAWNEDGNIFTSAGRVLAGDAFVISVQTGAIRAGKPRSWPKFLPGGKHLLYVSPDSSGSGLRAYAAELSTGRETELMLTDTQVTFTPDQPGSTQGHLLFGRAATLLAMRFDMRGLRVLGEPVPVAQDVPFMFGVGWSEFDTSREGTLIYSTGPQEAQLTWLDRGGRELGVLDHPRDFFGFLRLSPDGLKVAYDVFDFRTGGQAIWAYSLAHETAEPVTFTPGSNSSPVWSPDGGRLAFGSGQTGPLQLRVKGENDRGGGDTFPHGVFQLPTDWSSDGRWIFYQNTGGEANGEIWIASTADRKISPLLQTQFDCSFAALSPDQTHVAFSANDTGHSEIYVQRFLGGDRPNLIGERRRISHNGGNGARWRRDGKELFFLSPDRQVMAVDVEPGTAGAFGPPAALFRLATSYRSLVPVAMSFEVSPDGQRFLVPVRRAVGAPLQVVVNWQTALKG
jgi:eukaryotic-like serine/threonine-protein kinase